MFTFYKYVTVIFLTDADEIKTSVDIMKNAAGENAREIVLVKIFEEVCSVFIPVLFDLKEYFGYTQFRRVCKAVSVNIGDNRQRREEVLKNMVTTY